jgi:hypothetical protein
MRSGVSGVNAYFQPRKTDLHHDSADAIAHSIVNSIFSKGIIGIAVQPMLARLRRRDHWMSTGVRMFAGVLIRRAVAAKRQSTCLAGPEMDPIGTDLHAFFAFAPMRLLDRVNCNRIKMRTPSGTHDRLV